jgi:hypothetical protein
VPLHKQQARSLKAARKAALSGDAPAVKTALLDWGRLQWPDDAPRSIGALSSRLNAPLAEELERLCASTYGLAGEAAWDGQALARALRSFSVVEDDRNSRESSPANRLPPLMPGRA